MNNFEITQLADLSINEIEPLRQESEAEGFVFVNWLVADYESGKNRFAKSGEALFAVRAQGALIAVGGLNWDPYLNNHPAGKVGRVRRVYVRQTWRRQGVGAHLMHHIIENARPFFQLLTLRTPTANASAFYTALGFQTTPPLEGATHYLWLS